MIVNGECVRSVRLLELPDIPVQQDNGRGTQLFGLALDYPVCPGDEISARVDTDEAMWYRSPIRCGLDTVQLRILPAFSQQRFVAAYLYHARAVEHHDRDRPYAPY